MPKSGTTSAKPCWEETRTEAPPKILQGLVRQVLGEEVCQVFEAGTFDHRQQLVNGQLLKGQVLELIVLGHPAKPDPRSQAFWRTWSPCGG
eukprot:15444057-Alexandrium_andersonii.AAC.1